MNQRYASQKLEVQIMGQSYTLSCPDGGAAALQDAVDKVDATMCAIRDAGRIKSRDRIAVLACLNIAHELGRDQAEASHQQRLGGLIDRLDQALASNDSPESAAR